MAGKDGCHFCRIVAGQAEAEQVLSDALAVAFLDERPLFPGHILLVPRRHVETLADLPAEQVGPFFARAQLLCLAVEGALDAEGSFVAINNRVSQSVPHLHVHVVPRRRKDGLRGFFWPRNQYRSAQHRQEVAAKLRATLSALAGDLR